MYHVRHRLERCRAQLPQAGGLPAGVLYVTEEILAEYEAVIPEPWQKKRQELIHCPRLAVGFSKR